MNNSPTALNKHGRKVLIDGYKFDSQKEANFYVRFVKDSGAEFEVHPKFEIMKSFMTNCGKKIAHMVYTPDIVIYDSAGQMLHVFDIKNGFTPYAIDSAAKLRFKLFTKQYGRFVEIVVVRTHDFKTSAYLFESLKNIHVHKSINY
ncbi:hypothetical protein AYR56_05305 [Loigolactobacillus backii]|uniref:DUF1064 domain-containing protein n=1 Tax=Loigolactobacillus backii TaxID=375175 RepID=A0A192H578_9LACO|nr:DUF1064 domain-containing protein [Loigolactobacillus backii]ANK63377.1 hypothetical protein AYR53_11700 [Loigolactobacillus backii]ANK69618.1 hypothetical protein AYR56_05305 [Loigolactobacillus backii]